MATIELGYKIWSEFNVSTSILSGLGYHWWSKLLCDPANNLYEKLRYNLFIEQSNNSNKPSMIVSNLGADFYCPYICAKIILSFMVILSSIFKACFIGFSWACQDSFKVFLKSYMDASRVFKSVSSITKGLYRG